MSRMNELSLVLDEMIECGEGMIKAARTLKEIFSETSAPETPAEQPKADIPAEVPAETQAAPAEKEYTFEDVRKAFSQKSHEGHTDEVRAIIAKFGAEKLSKVSKEFYPALMKELEAVG